MSDEEAQKARAKRLHAQIKKIASPDDKTDDQPKSPSPIENPRDFVHRKMREAEAAEKKKSVKGDEECGSS